MMKQIRIRKGKERSLQRFHPWVFSGAVARKDKGLQDGDIVEVTDQEGRFLAMGHYADSSIMVRVFSFEPVTPNDDFWRGKVQRALDYRHTIGLPDSRTTMFRLVNGEGDGLPGLIIDLYGDQAVVQCHSLGMYQLRDTFARILHELLPDLRCVYNKSNQTLNNACGLDEPDCILWGEMDEEVIAMENGVPYKIDIVGGQKTGFFLDQRDSRAMVEQYARGKRVLNMFCYSGGFSSYALRGGATHVDSVDISRGAIELTRQNVHLLGPEYEQRHNACCEDVFAFLEQRKQPYDLIVLDPPAFAKHLKVKEQGIKGYRTINRKAMQLLKPGGLLFTFSCSQAISLEDFKTILFSAAALEHKNIRVVHQMQQAPDHPVNIYHPEGTYLKGLLLAIGH
ncbi:MAG: class I SAM-dependent rRNA methyltransferase [Bacteroidales bacterium]|nr:class I SAM-dependent rRNA methyltransferase [Bacteroidales bacterium]